MSYWITSPSWQALLSAIKNNSECRLFKFTRKIGFNKGYRKKCLQKLGRYDTDWF